MTTKNALYAFAVVVLMGTMAVAAFAEAPVMEAYESADSSVSAQPDQGMEQADAGEIREPVETGALPDHTVKGDSEGWLNMDVSEQNSSPDLWGQPNIQAP